MKFEIVVVLWHTVYNMNNKVQVQPVKLLKSFKIVSQVVHGSLPSMGKAVNAISCMKFAVREKRPEL
jgi:hypothetical protein